jgi:GH35 family endo-1,4-beta-xylanase
MSEMPEMPKRPQHNGPEGPEEVHWVADEQPYTNGGDEQAFQGGRHIAPETGSTSRRALLVAAGSVAALGIATYAAYELGVWPFDDNNKQPHRPDQQSSTSEKSTGVEQQLPAEFDPSNRKSMLTDTWNMLGAVRNKHGGMDVKASGWAVRKVDDDGYIPRHPQLLYGPRVNTKGNDFGIAARMSDVKTEQATVYMHSTPDILLDEQVYRMPSVSATIKGDKVIINVYDGKKNEPAETHTIAATSTEDGTDVWFQQKGDHVIVGSGTKKQAIETAMFEKSKQVIFGADGDFALRNLDVYSTGNEPVEIRDTSTEALPPLDPSGFQALARANGRKDFIIGTALDLGPLDEVRPVLSQVGGIKTEMLAKMQAVFKGAPAENGDITEADFEWQEVDAFVDLARRDEHNKRNVDMHTLIFGEAMPAGVEAFLRKCAETKNKTAAANFMKQYITTFVDRYKDAVDTWDVVNEPLADTGDDNSATLRKHLWYEAFGGTEEGGIEYITLACQTARDAGAKRIRINENGCETNVPRRNKLRSIARPLKKAGILDAIGLQSHLDFGWEENDEGELEENGDISEYVNDDGVVDPTYVRDEYETYFSIFEQDGLEVDITELSIDVDESDRKHKQSRETIQAIVHAGIFDAAMKHKNVHSVYWWGMVNGDYYMTSERENGKIIRGNDAPYNADAKGKPVSRQNIVGAIKAGIRGEV